jgi:hypothetical protein
MDEKTYSMGGIGFLALFFLILISFWNRGGCGGFGGWGNNCGTCGGWNDGVNMTNYGFQNFKATCDAEKAEIINSARTQYLVEQQAAATRDIVTATANATQTKVDFYAYQGLRDQLAETQRALMEANNKLFVKDQLAPITAQLSSIQCNMLRRPDVTGVGAVCPNAGIINGLGINSLNACGCGCNGLV